MDFQKNLVFYREKAGYKTAKDFSKQLGISYTTYFAYENTGREPKFSLLCKIADLLNVSLDDLLGRSKNGEDEQIKATLQDAFNYFNYDLIQLSDSDEKNISFYLGTNLKFGKINIAKTFFIDEFKDAIAQGNDIKRTLIFNSAVTKIFNTADKKLSDDIKYTEAILNLYRQFKTGNLGEIKQLQKKSKALIAKLKFTNQIDLQSITAENLDEQIDKLEQTIPKLKDMQIRILRFQNYSKNLRQEVTIKKKQHLFDEGLYQDILNSDKKLD